MLSAVVMPGRYCDKGSLRDALKGRAFCLMPNASAAADPDSAGLDGSTPTVSISFDHLNYRGVLDTALDICKAMLHLHMADVVHGDLKVRACRHLFWPRIPVLVCCYSGSLGMPTLPMWTAHSHFFSGKDALVGMPGVAYNRKEHGHSGYAGHIGQE